METSSPESSRLELFDSARTISPPLLKRILPLRIVKRSDSDYGEPDTDLDDHAPRKCSQETDESRGSVPEPPGGERQLAIPKIRGHRISRQFESFAEIDESHAPLVNKEYFSEATKYTAYDSHSIPKTGFRSLNSRHKSNIRDCRINESVRSRHSPRLRGKAFTKSDVGFRDQFAFLTSRRTMPTAYRPFPGLINFIHGPGTTKDSVERQLSPSTPCAESEAFVDPFTSSLRFNDHGSPPIIPILVPIVCVTPDARVIDTGYHNFWVAVEVTADLHRPGEESRDRLETITPRSHDSTRSEEHGATVPGFLYDLHIEVESTHNSRVLEVVEHDASPNIFTAGSKALVLVNVELDLTNFSRLRGHIRSRSDELMEDLENQLGSLQYEYLKVNLVYRHSIFSSAAVFPGNASSIGGITKSDTKIRTDFTAAINRYDAASPWSPPPAPAPNRLVGVIAAH
ncbi:hypothetical protein N0V93_007448 [Gnomoniopsis smithogilvyi]|uniref:Uncharacterized protein n=1 Tax=Gnomoniopsis smithogilvyi TaxID=1191159 RepID=A0A9W9CWM0_9PEZI|nr:hypothetical protein N0V93_007448 [Gnomoniopsis smithogilvyi]